MVGRSQQASRLVHVAFARASFHRRCLRKSQSYHQLRRHAFHDGGQGIQRNVAILACRRFGFILIVLVMVFFQLQAISTQLTELWHEMRGESKYPRR